MARILAAAAVLWLLPVVAPAQDALPSAALQMGLPSASLQMRTPGVVPFRDLFAAPPGTYAPTFEQPHRVDPRFFPCCGAFAGGPVFFPGFYSFDSGLTHVPGYFPGFANAVGSVKPSWARGSHSNAAPGGRLGHLRLLVEPDTTQVHVDGFYVGTVAGLGRLVTLTPGPHHVELHAPGYGNVGVDVQILPTETITYRTGLQPSEAAVKPAPAPVAGTPKTFYVIPSCYAGDRPPEPGALPPGCNIAHLRTIPPRIP
jgi:hypothetical protein